MKTTATQLKTKMGRYMREVRAGREVVITDRGVTVARLVPFDELPAPAEPLPLSQPRDPDAPRLGALRLRPIRARGTHSTELLHEDRQRR